MGAFNDKVIAESIDWLVANWQAQPDLARIARRAGYDATHFQKMFSERVGLSPKKLVQYMNARHARELLLQGRTTLQAAHETGLSGQGRLHDLLVTIEGATPGEVKSRGEGLTITYGFHPTPLGEMLVAETGKGVCYLGFLMDEARDVPIKKMQAHFPRAAYVHDDRAVEKTTAHIMEIWRGESGEALKLDLHGTNLQIQVWKALLKIQGGETVTYQDIARQLGRPKAARAVGNAVGANPVSLLVPCHRVIRATGIIDNYGWGSPRKKLILGLEGQLFCLVDQQLDLECF